MAAQLGGREACRAPRALRRATPSARRIERSIAAARARLDQLPAHRAQSRVRDGRETERPVAGERPRGRAEQRIAREAAVELGRVVVEREHEPRAREAVLGRGADDDAAVGPLPGDARRRRRAAPRQAPLRLISRSRYGPVGVTTSSTMPARRYRGRGGCAALARYLRPDEARRRRLAPLAPAEAPALPRRAAARRRRRPCSTSGSTRSASAPRAASRAAARTTSSRSTIPGRSGSPRSAFTTARGFRARYPTVAYVQGDACALPFADDGVRRRLLERRDRARRRSSSGSGCSSAEALRVGRRVFLTTPNRWFPIEVHTRLPLVHWLPEAAQPVAPTTSPARAGRRRTTCSAAGDLRRLFPGPVRIVNLGHDAGGDHMSDRVAAHRARRLRRRARASTTS